MHIAQEAIEVARGLSKATTGLVQLAAEPEYQRAARPTVVQKRSRPPGHGRGVRCRAKALLDPLGLRVVEESHGEAKAKV